MMQELCDAAKLQGYYRKKKALLVEKLVDARLSLQDLAKGKRNPFVREALERICERYDIQHIENRSFQSLYTALIAKYKAGRQPPRPKDPKPARKQPDTSSDEDSRSDESESTETSDDGRQI